MKAESYTTFKGYPSIYGELTSNIDFCEANFQYNSYLAEPMNTISCIFYILLSLHFIYNVKKYTHSFPYNFRFYLVGLLATLLGIGSAFLHATLTRWAQYTDELPMTYVMMMSIWVMIFQYDDWNINNNLFKMIVTCFLLFISLGQTIAMIWYPNSYFLFFIIFTSMVLGACCLEIKLFYFNGNVTFIYNNNTINNNNNNTINNNKDVENTIQLGKVVDKAINDQQQQPEQLNDDNEIEKIKNNVRYCYSLYFCSFLFAFIVWLIDFQACPYVYPFQLHSIWHLFTALAAYQKGVCLHYLTLIHHGVKNVHVIRSGFGLVPYVVMGKNI